MIYINISIKYILIKNIRLWSKNGKRKVNKNLLKDSRIKSKNCL